MRWLKDDGSDGCSTKTSPLVIYFHIQRSHREKRLRWRIRNFFWSKYFHIFQLQLITLKNRGSVRQFLNCLLRQYYIKKIQIFPLRLFFSVEGALVGLQKIIGRKVEHSFVTAILPRPPEEELEPMHNDCNDTLPSYSNQLSSLSLWLAVFPVIFRGGLICLLG